MSAFSHEHVLDTLSAFIHTVKTFVLHDASLFEIASKSKLVTSTIPKPAFGENFPYFSPPLKVTSTFWSL